LQESLDGGFGDEEIAALLQQSLRWRIGPGDRNQGCCAGGGDITAREKAIAHATDARLARRAIEAGGAGQARGRRATPGRGGRRLLRDIKMRSGIGPLRVR
jgi:hypothetical protein